MTAPQRPQPIYDSLELRVDPEAPVRLRRCPRCGDLDDIVSPTGLCDDCFGRDGDALGWVTVAFVVLLSAVIIAAVGWYLAAPRPAPDSTAPPPAGDVSQPASGASGPGLSGAPLLGKVSGAPETVIGEPLEVIRGTATWYCNEGQAGTSRCTRGYGPGDMVAAIDTDLGFSKGDVVIVRSLAADKSVRVRIVDVCGCPGNRLIDLTSGAFRRLAPLGFGVIPVTVELARGRSDPTLPPTETEP